MNRAMYGSRWSSPYCPGVSYYEDDTQSGGKKCKSPTGLEFEIDKDGKCATASGGSIAVSGPVCPGTSLGDLDFPDGSRTCTIDGKSFKIDSKGECIDKSNCADTAAELAKKAYDKGKQLASDAYDKGKQLASDAYDKGKEAYDKIKNKQGVKSKLKCYLRKQKGKKSKKRVCLSKKAVQRRLKGARKGGRKSHK